MEQDFLDEMIEESTKSNPEFPSLLEEACQRRILHLCKSGPVNISEKYANAPDTRKGCHYILDRSAHEM